MMWLLWFLLIVLAALLLHRVLQTDGSEAADEESAREILRKRYARGEISRNEFEQYKQDLENQS